MKNEIDKTFTPEQLQTIDDALTALENTTSDLPVLSRDDKATHVKPPDSARGWMEQMVARAQQNINKLPRDFDPDVLQRDLDFTGTVSPRLIRAQRIVDRLVSGSFLADSDAFAACLEMRRRLKDAGVAGVDDNLSDGLKRFFSRTSPKTTPPTPK